MGRTCFRDRFVVAHASHKRRRSRAVRMISTSILDGGDDAVGDRSACSSGGAL